MAISPASGPRDTASSGSSSCSVEHLIDERDFDTLPLIPTEPMVDFQTPARPTKIFSVQKDEVSERALAEGFSWQRKEPNRPGQFSERPQKRPVPKPDGNIRNAGLEVIQPPKVPQQTLSKQGDAFELPDISFHEDLFNKTQTPKSQINVSQMPSTTDSTGQRLPKMAANFSSVSVDPGLCDGVLPTRGISNSRSPETDTSDIRMLPGDVCGVDLDHPVSRPSALKVQPGLSSASSHQSPGISSKNRHDQNNGLLCFNQGRSAQPMAHLASRDYRMPSQGSPQRSCGDLEGPGIHRSPLQRPYRRESPTGNNQIAAAEYQSRRLHRSRSRTSNISRKRARVEKHEKHHRSRSHNRKQLAMHQVAQYWNECLRISEEEKLLADSEVERLQETLRVQDSKLDESRSMLRDKEGQIKRFQERCEGLEDQGQRASDDRKRLDAEAQSLRNQLSESQERATVLEEKYRTYRLKLNEAISEQQNLFRRSQTYYQDAMAELHREKEKHFTDSEAIEKALETSHKKREEIKNCMDEFRAESRRECQQKDIVILNLRDKLEYYERDLNKQRELIDDLHRQVEFQQSLSPLLQTMEDKLNAALHLHEQKADDSSKSTEKMAQMDHKLNEILEKMNMEDSIYQNDHSGLSEKIQKGVITRILPAVLTLAATQASSEDAIKRLTNSLQNGLRDLLKSTRQHEYSDEQLLTRDRNEHAKLSSLVNRLESGLRQAQVVWQHMEKRMMVQTETHEDTTNAGHRTCHIDLMRQLVERNEAISELQRQLQLTTEDYAGKIEDIRASILKDGNSARNLLEDAVSELQDKLEERLNLAQEHARRLGDQSKTGQATLENQLKEAQENLVQVAADAATNNEKLQMELINERSNVAELTGKAMAFEEGAKANAMLCQRWNQDIRAADSMRKQLQALSGRLPQMENLGEKLDKIACMNGVIHSTATYLADERDWVHKQLKSTLRSMNVSTDTEDISCIPEAITLAPNADSADTASQKVKLDDAQSQRSASVSMIDVTSLGDSLRRRVTVHSPNDADDYPFPPPSVEQEQARRRAATRPRSILKFSLSSVPGLREPDEQLLGAPANHSQYNRPVCGGLSSAAHIANGVVKQIRSGFIRQPKPLRDWSFPTVADFERDCQPRKEDESLPAPVSGSQELTGIPGTKRERQGESEETHDRAKFAKSTASLVTGDHTGRRITRNYGRTLHDQPQELKPVLV